MKTVNIKINGYDYTVKQGITILDASFESMKFQREFMQQPIPTLYYLKGVVDVDESGVCVAEADGELVNASTTRVREGMEILTRSEKVTAARKEALAKLLATHNKSCIYCMRSTSCELQNLLHEYGFTDEPELPQKDIQPLDLSSVVLVRDNNKCIRCKRCVNVCAKMQAVSAIAATGTGLDTIIAPSSPKGLAAASCVNCGQCVAVCPVGALTEKPHIDMVKEAIADPEKYVVVQVAPAVRAALGETFEFPIGVDVEGRMAGALRALGFDKVFDTKVAADLTIIEEANELIERVRNDGVLPMITSCCPGWVKYAEHFYPDMLENISSCKSPHTMFGAIIKSWYAKKMGIPKEMIVTVSVMPCTAKKFEITRDDECGAGVPDVDYVLTTNELGKMLKDAEIQLEAISPTEKFDDPLGEGSGAGVIFGATGGVMEAALRTAYFALEGKEHDPIEFKEVRGFEAIREASIEMGGMTVNVAVTSGMRNAKVLLDQIRDGSSKYHFIEIMCCPGGCINGGGMPYVRTAFLPNEEPDIMETYRSKRAAALYSEDERQAVRQSHNNPQIKELYAKFLGEPNSHLAHELLHTSYAGREPFRIAKKEA
ncbi:MAG: [Oscillospiraceae bacterium]|nr:[FeFe] hydrogenase, group A [Oscillospiraceae bacterium]